MLDERLGARVRLSWLDTCLVLRIVQLRQPSSSPAYSRLAALPTAAVPQAFCAHAPVLHKRALACFEVHLPNLAHLLVRLSASAHLLAMVRRIGFLALDTSCPKSLAWLASWMCMSCLAREETTCLAIFGVVAMTTHLEATANLSPTQPSC